MAETSGLELASTETCPVCGQEYDHYREESPDQTKAVLRDDATACRVEKDLNTFDGREEWKVYVHV